MSAWRSSDVDLVIDPVGGPTTSRFLTTLKRGALVLAFGLGVPPVVMWHKKLGATISTTQVRSSGDQLAQISQLPEDGTVRVAACSIGSFALARLRTFSGTIEREFSAILGSREWAGMDLDGIDASRDGKRQTPCSLNRRFLGGILP